MPAPHSLITLLLLLLLLPGRETTAGPSGVSSEERTIRVRLFELQQPGAVTVIPQGGPARVYAGDYDNPVAELRPGEESILRVGHQQVYLRTGERGMFAQMLRIVPAAGGTIELAAGEGAGRPQANRYPGVVYVDLDPAVTTRLRLINEVELDEYVAAVLSREYPFDDGDGARAMAVLIRTYALGSLDKFGPDYDVVDHVGSQVYTGIADVTPAMREAVRQTRGEVLTHNGRLIQAVYFSSSGGHTADNESVWQSDAIPYLRGRPDPYDQASPHTSWRSVVSRPELLAVLTQAYRFDVQGFHLGDRGPDGRVQQIYLLRPDGSRQSVRASEFRGHVLRRFGASSLRSTNFTARRIGDVYEFQGRGNGHGVGLSQWGAHELARQGKTYREILDYYYRDVALTRLDGTRTPPPAPPADRNTVRRAEANPPTTTPPATSGTPARGRIGW